MESTLPPPKKQHSTWTWILGIRSFPLGTRRGLFSGVTHCYNFSTTGGADLQSISLEKRRILHGLTAQAGVPSVFFFPQGNFLCVFFWGETVPHLEGTPSYRNFGQGKFSDINCWTPIFLEFCLQQGGTWRYCSRCSSQGQSSPLSFLFWGDVFE